MPLHHEQLTELIIGAAIEVDRHLGPGLLESAYRRVLRLTGCNAGLLLNFKVKLPKDGITRRVL